MAATAPILVAFATANTGSKVVEQLSAAGHAVRALVRNPDKPEAKALAALPHVEVVKGDIDSGEGIKEALTGVKRAFLTTGAGDARDWRMGICTAMVSMCGPQFVALLRGFCRPPANPGWHPCLPPCPASCARMPHRPCGACCTALPAALIPLHTEGIFDAHAHNLSSDAVRYLASSRQSRLRLSISPFFNVAHAR